MAEHSKIEWTDATFNPWIGCTRISPACDFCYAESMSARYGWAEWGNHPRKRTSESTWQAPRRWQRQAATFALGYGRRRRVFCASLADVFDNQVPPYWRDDLWALIHECPDLDWQLLTKRPQNIPDMLPDYWDEIRGHVWLGATCEDQTRADQNIPHVLNVDPAPAVRFVSYEPALGPVDFGAWLDRLDWIIAGGESGPNARPAHPEWVRNTRDQCAAADVEFHFKQWGGWLPCEPTGNVPLWRFQDGSEFDRHCFPADFDKEPAWDDGLSFVANGERHAVFLRVGKARAGRLLDGVTHDGFPAS